MIDLSDWPVALRLGYATHLEEVAKTAWYLKCGGYVAIGLGTTSSYLKVQEACLAGGFGSPRLGAFLEGWRAAPQVDFSVVKQ
ncbi:MULTISPECIES: hypothetical protein [Pseudomonas]|uniref:hypothetical protein n=1 Tax=Pseudomonas TaxID=286 RepID=UPI001CE4A386|nr:MULTISPECIES: hypothetical protein [Pseudomonas]MCO7597434.1 hypothetical protein [Pseudomonas guariconensis]MCU7223156.1 hypothetical protein [Pseudomonas brassicacearum]